MYLTTKRKMMYLVLALSSAGLSYAGTGNATAIAAVQQQATCKGVVVDSKGEPIIGASVTAVVNGQKKGAISDLDGNFEIAGIRHNPRIQTSSYIFINLVFIAHCINKSINHFTSRTRFRIRKSNFICHNGLFMHIRICLFKSEKTRNRAFK